MQEDNFSEEELEEKYLNKKMMMVFLSQEKNFLRHWNP